MGRKRPLQWLELELLRELGLIEPFKCSGRYWSLGSVSIVPLRVPLFVVMGLS